MATLQKRGKVWRAQIRIAGSAPESATFATRAEAKAWGEQRAEDLRRGYSQASPITLGTALRRYASDVSPTKRGARWEQLRLAKIDRDWPLRSKNIAVISGADIAAWRDARLKAVAPGTVSREMNLLRSVFEIARKEWGIIRDNPMSDIKRPTSPPARRRRVPQDEIDRICIALGYLGGDPVSASDRVALSFLFALETAMRAGEIIGLRWADVHLVDKYVNLPKTKNGDARQVPLSTRAAEIIGLLDRSTDSVFNVGGGVRDALFRRARQNAEIENLHYHDSRAEAIWRLSKKLDVLQLARVIGHRDIKSLLLYYNESATDIAKLLA